MRQTSTGIIKKEQTGGDRSSEDTARALGRQDRAREQEESRAGGCPQEAPQWRARETLQGEGVLVTGQTAPAGSGERVTSRINSRGPWRPVPVQLPLFLQGSQGEFPSVTGGVYDFINCIPRSENMRTGTWD